MRAPTGQQFTLTRGGTAATITELAAGIRSFSIDGVELVEPFAETAGPPMGCGIVLVPWPNRIREGAWLLDGERQQLDLTDPRLKQATHGLLRNSPYRVASQQPDAITLAATVFPQHGYPFLLDTSVQYQLVDHGLTVAHTIHNLSDAAAPVAIGAHPYFRIGDVPTAELTLTIAASTRFELDESLLPIAEHGVDGDFDLRAGRRLGEIDLNVTLGGLPVGATSSLLSAPDGRSLEIWQDPDFRYVQVYTPRNFPRLQSDGSTADGHAVAIEPMTAAPDAFNSGLGLRWLQPGETWTASWGIRYTA
ncbi:MAG: aldose 1-epimerase family protein [Microbacteriaceae bacterium]